MIAFYGADVAVPLKQRMKIKRWLNDVAVARGFVIQTLSYVFCSDEFLLKMNNDFLQHDYYTDIITFPIQEESGTVNGECYISVDRVRDNAKENRVTFAIELNRVMVHGLLHLMGEKDKSKEEIERMRAAENKALNHWRSTWNAI